MVQARLASAVVLLGTVVLLAACQSGAGPSAEVTSGADAMGLVSIAVIDRCDAAQSRAVSALSVWVDRAYDHEVLLTPGVGRDRYETLAGPLPGGRHVVELRGSAFWPPVDCLQVGGTDVKAIEVGQPRYVALRHAPVLEVRADTVGEATDVPLFMYVEGDAPGGTGALTYTTVFSNEDGGTQTRALLARWGRATDIEQIYDVRLRGSVVEREDYQGPDHEIRAFRGRRRGAAPVLLVATMNNMVTDRGRGIASVRLVPVAVDLAESTRESVMDDRPWAYRVMARELAAEGRIQPDAPVDGRWMNRIPDPRSYVYLEARLKLERSVVAAWVRDGQGRRFWSHHERLPMAIGRDGWVRTAVAVGPDPAPAIAEMGWACLAAPDETGEGTCDIEATRAFVLGADYRPGVDLAVPSVFHLAAGGVASQSLAPHR